MNSGRKKVEVGAGLNAIARMQIVNGIKENPNGRQGGHQKAGMFSSGNSGGDAHTINQGNMAKRVNKAVQSKFATKGEQVAAHRAAMKFLNQQGK